MGKKTLPHSNTTKDKKIDDMDFISVNLSLVNVCKSYCFLKKILIICKNEEVANKVLIKIIDLTINHRLYYC